jgi:hypothetical protein
MSESHDALPEDGVPPPAEPSEYDRDAARNAYTRTALILVAVGVVVQLGLSAYYLSVGHSPSPRHLPVGFVAPAASRAALAAQIDAGGSFKAVSYPGPKAMTEAIRTKRIYGGVDVSATRAHLYVASAAGISASTAIRNAFAAVIQQYTGKQVAALVAKGRPVPASVVQALTAPRAVTDVAPLPKADRSGGSIGLLVQALALGATVASLGLGRLTQRTRRSMRRGIGHVGTLVLYAAASAGAVLLAAAWFGIIPGSATGRLYLDFCLLSLAITASTAGVVSIVGPLGAIVGTLYFTLGLIISGSSILPEFLPTFGRVVGQALPTGAGVNAIRDSLYFPAASIAGPVTVLAIYTALGLLAVLITNTRPNRTSRAAELDLPGA